MKKSVVLCMTLGLLIAAGCKQEKKQTEESKSDSQAKISFVNDSTNVRFTAYKTTEKLPVGGTFQKINIDYTPGATLEEALNGLTFSIPVSSLFTNDATKTRDPKLLEFFFNVMADPELISGTITVGENQTCTVKLKMNGVTAELPMTYKVSSGHHVAFTGTMDLNKWNAQEALASLNKACYELHMGADKVSKTWDEVGLTATLFFKEEAL